MCSAVGQNYRLQDIQFSYELSAVSSSSELFFDIVWDDSRCPRRHLTRPTRDPRPQVSGGHRREVTPVPIPNTEVKLSTADGTAWETAWESRSLPGLTIKAGCVCIRPFLFGDHCHRGRTTQPTPAIGGNRPPGGAAGGNSDNSPRVG